MVNPQLEKPKTGHEIEFGLPQLNDQVVTVEYYVKPLHLKTMEVIKNFGSSFSSLKFSRYFFGALNKVRSNLLGLVWIIASLIISTEFHTEILSVLPIKKIVFFGYELSAVYIIVTVISLYVWLAQLALLAFYNWRPDDTTVDSNLDQEDGVRVVDWLFNLYTMMSAALTIYPIRSEYLLQWVKMLACTPIAACAVIIWLRGDIERFNRSNNNIVLILVMYILELNILLSYMFDDV